MIRRIVILLSGTASDEGACTAAVTLAKRLGAVVEGLYIKIDPSELMFRLGEGVAATAIDDILKSAEKEADAAAIRGRAVLENAARNFGLSLLPDEPAGAGAGAIMRSVQGPAMDVLTEELGLADLVVFGEPGDQAPIDLLPKIEHTLMHLRRPILIARGRVGSSFGDKILVPFNGTVEACSALSGAAEIVTKASAIEVLTLRESEEDDGASTRAVRYIALYGARAIVQQQAPSGRGIGEDIATRASVIGADLVVMGGYGRSRLRELVLGGATRHMLNHSPVPVLLAH